MDFYVQKAEYLTICNLSADDEFHKHFSFLKTSKTHINFWCLLSLGRTQTLYLEEKRQANHLLKNFYFITSHKRLNIRYAKPFYWLFISVLQHFKNLTSYIGDHVNQTILHHSILQATLEVIRFFLISWKFYNEFLIHFKIGSTFVEQLRIVSVEKN